MFTSKGSAAKGANMGLMSCNHAKLISIGFSNSTDLRHGDDGKLTMGGDVSWCPLCGALVVVRGNGDATDTHTPAILVGVAAGASLEPFIGPMIGRLIRMGGPEK